MNYLVKWDIDIEANSPKEAAEIALSMQRDPKSLATCFVVVDQNNCIHEFDLEEGTCH